MWSSFVPPSASDVSPSAFPLTRTEVSKNLEIIVVLAKISGWGFVADKGNQPTVG